MTDFEDLKAAWQSQQGVSEDEFDRIREMVQSGAQSMHSTIFKRDMAESVAALLGIVFFAPLFLHSKNWLVFAGAVVVVLAAISIPFVLWWARRNPLSTNPDTSYCEQVDAEIEYLRRQDKLLKGVTWWFLAPIYVGIVLVSIGMSLPMRDLWFSRIFLGIYLPSVLAFTVYVWRLNERARKERVQPVLDYFVAMRDAVHSGDDLASFSSGPPFELLAETPRRPLTRRKRLLWILATLVVTIAILAGGYFLSLHFNRRTGIFVACTAPVVSCLLVVVSGVARRNVNEGT